MVAPVRKGSGACEPEDQIYLGSPLECLTLTGPSLWPAQIAAAGCLCGGAALL